MDYPNPQQYYNKQEVDIFPHDTIESVTRSVHEAEHRILPEVLRNLNIGSE